MEEDYYRFGDYRLYVDFSESGLSSIEGLDKISSGKKSVSVPRIAELLRSFNRGCAYKLDLSNNQLTQLNIPYLLRILPELRVLKDRNNAIKSVLFPPKLENIKIDLSGNPLERFDIEKDLCYDAGVRIIYDKERQIINKERLQTAQSFSNICLAFTSSLRVTPVVDDQ